MKGSSLFLILALFVVAVIVFFVVKNGQVEHLANQLENHTPKIKNPEIHQKNQQNFLTKQEGKIWVSRNPIQCLRNPWEIDWLKSHHNDRNSYPNDTEGQWKVVKGYYKKSGVEIYEIKSKKFEDNITCSGCSCPAGYTLYLQIDESNLYKMKTFGFKEVNA